jgi:hypothetical protein
MVSTQSQAQTIEEKLNEWIDPVTETPDGIKYCLYGTSSRGMNTKGSYLIFFPPKYEVNRTEKFPVMYWLHGGNGTAREGIWAVKNYEKGMKLGLMPQTIIVSVQALPVGRYVDSKDGKQPIEQVII